MCEGRSGRWASLVSQAVLRASALGTCLLMLASGVAGAQTAEERRARVERLVQAWRTADSLADAEQRATEANVVVDTLALGRFLVISDSLEAGRLRAAAAEAWRDATEALGPTDLRLADGGRVFIQFTRDGVSWNHLVGENTAASPSVTFVNNPNRLGEAGIERAILHAIAQTVIGRAGGTLRTWTGGRTGVSDGDLLFDWAFVELATAPSQAARFCLLGDLSWCARALMLVPTPDPLTTLLDAGDRRALAEGRFATNVPRGLLAVFERCTAGADDAACLDYVRSRTRGRPPLSTRSNAALLWGAKKLGGDGAFTRLSADTSTSLGARLEAAARVPLDSLLGSWRDTLLARRPAPASARLPADWIALVWVVAFGGLALRSSRWR